MRRFVGLPFSSSTASCTLCKARRMLCNRVYSTYGDQCLRDLLCHRGKPWKRYKNESRRLLVEPTIGDRDVLFVDLIGPRFAIF